MRVVPFAIGLLAVCAPDAQGASECRRTEGKVPEWYRPCGRTGS
jgi:hypothetical protein